MKPSDPIFPLGWRQSLPPAIVSSMLSFLASDVHAGYLLNPSPSLVFRALQEVDLPDVRVVVLGQDPYPNHLDACGLSFSVPPGRPVPASLKNVFKEISRDTRTSLPPWQRVSGDISHWAQQGVLLLNADLTTRAGYRAAHFGYWRSFTKAVFVALRQHRQGVVYMLWGRSAKDWAEAIDKRCNLVLEAAHPSPLAGNTFSGCGHFTKANDYLAQHGHKPIDWTWAVNY